MSSINRSVVISKLLFGPFEITEQSSPIPTTVWLRFFVNCGVIRLMRPNSPRSDNFISFFVWLYGLFFSTLGRLISVLIGINSRNKAHTFYSIYIKKADYSIAKSAFKVSKYDIRFPTLVRSRSGFKGVFSGHLTTPNGDGKIY